jgi:hypothetical protein
VYSDAPVEGRSGSLLLPLRWFSLILSEFGFSEVVTIFFAVGGHFLQLKDIFCS